VCHFRGTDGRFLPWYYQEIWSVGRSGVSINFFLENGFVVKAKCFHLFGQVASSHNTKYLSFRISKILFVTMPNVKQSRPATTPIAVSPCDSFMHARGQWIKANNNMILPTVSVSPQLKSNGPIDHQFRVAHLNVLLPAAKWYLQPYVRYHYQLSRLLPQLGADVYCFNECTQTYLSKLQSKEWVQNGYYLSHATATPRKAHEVMICSKKPFRCYR
jgi:hypothetical protein